jgi:two-component system, NarL family, invasion response regulator UvrY
VIRVIVADDHAVVRKGLIHLLAEEPDIRVVAETSSADEALERIQRQVCDVLVLDMSMAGRSGLDALAELRALPYRPRVLILTIFADDTLAVRCLKAGADGYVTKDAAPQELVGAIRRIHSGRKYISDGVAEKLALGLLGDGQTPAHESLSDREYSVLCLLASGKTVSQIAEVLSLSVKTVSTYRTRILEKLHLSNTAELMHYAIQHCLDASRRDSP